MTSVTVTGTLFRKKGARAGDPAGWMVRWPTKKGGTADAPMAPDQLASTLQDRTEAEIPVDLDIEQGRPKRIRLPGEAWVAPVAAEATPVPSERRRQQAAARRGPPPRQGSDDRHRDRSGGARHDGDTGAATSRFNFHNPYNFVPAPPRTKVGPLADAGDPGSGGLPGHGRYQDGRFSGRIPVTMTVVTPLLIPDAFRAKEDDGHKTFPLRLEHSHVGEDTPRVPPTSVKGMLRASYEAITNSRFGVFRSHDQRLGFRLPSDVARYRNPKTSPTGTVTLPSEPCMFPARIENGTLQLMRAARWPQYKGAPRGSGIRHGQRVMFQEEPIGYDRLVRAIKVHSGSVPAGWQEGWACVTNENAGLKRCERVFFDAVGAPIKLEDQWRDDWNLLMKEYLEINREQIEERRSGRTETVYRGEGPGEPALSRHLYVDSDYRLQDGQLCYAFVFEGKILALYPVTIPRDLYGKSPHAFLHDSLRLAKDWKDLSPADRVFGWVIEKGRGAYKGNLRVGPVRLIEETPKEGAIETFDPPLPLAILGQPKPQQIRFYGARDQNGTPLDKGLARYRSEYRSGGKGLRGRKVYPHHKNLPESYWQDAVTAAAGAPKAIKGNRFREYLRAPSTNESEEQRDDQNRSIEAWVRPETLLAFNVHVTNLTKVELGALLWLLKLPPEHYYRLGGGKPLGFGSVRLELGDELDLADGRWLENWYASFGAPASDAAGAHLVQADDSDVSAIVEAFQTAVEEAYGDGKPFEEIPFIRAFLNAAHGIGSDDQPVHYPRVIPEGHERGYPPPRTSGENFKWFQENEKQGKCALPSLAEEEVQGLTLYKESKGGRGVPG